MHHGPAKALHPKPFQHTHRGDVGFVDIRGDARQAQDIQGVSQHRERRFGGVTARRGQARRLACAYVFIACLIPSLRHRPHQPAPKRK